MSDAAHTSWTDDPDGAAGEYVLGTLPAEERAAFARALATDPSLRAAVAAWEARLAPLASGIPAVAPDPGTWEKVRARIALKTGRDAPDAGSVKVVALERAVRRWRWAAGGAGALAACLALLLVLDEKGPQDVGPQYVAVVNRGGELPALVVRVDLKTGVVQVRNLSADPPADRSLELWYVAAGAAPRSLGLVGAPASRFAVPAALRETADGGSLAVSVEPKGGSPTGAPTGPVVYSGRLVRD